MYFIPYYNYSNSKRSKQKSNFGVFTWSDALYLNMVNKYKIAKINYNKTTLFKHVRFNTYASTWSLINGEFINYFATLTEHDKKILIAAIKYHINHNTRYGSLPSYDDSNKLLKSLQQ